MAFSEAIKSWTPKQHLVVLGIGLALMSIFSVMVAFIALAYYSPGAFLAIIALAVFAYVLGVFFSVVLIGRGE